MGVNILRILELTRLTCCEVIGKAYLKMAQDGNTCAKVEAQVGILQTILTHLRVIYLIAHGETKLWTYCQIDTCLAAKTDVITNIYGNIQRLLINIGLLNLCTKLVVESGDIYTKAHGQ